MFPPSSIPPRSLASHKLPAWAALLTRLRMICFSASELPDTAVMMGSALR